MRTRALLVLVAMVTLAMVLAVAPAGAKKPPCDELPPENPDYCGTSSTTTTTTTTAVPDEIWAGTICGSVPEELQLEWLPQPTELEGLAETGGFTFTLTGKSDFDEACIDVETLEDLQWKVTITGQGARYLGIIPRDSFLPGDSCGGYLLRSAAKIYDTHYLGYEGFIPATTINACDRYHPPGFGEWVDPSLEGVVCAETDPELGCKVVGELDVTHPFAFQAFMRGNAGEKTEITVEFLPLES